MTDLLPKTHRILEKGMMEFRPFGKNVNGELIQDVIGVSVRANLEFLEETVTQHKGRAAGERVVTDLVNLLNERIPDRAFHVSPEFLKNPWNSYSYEFVMFVAEFCVILSGNPHFHLNMGREKILSPIIQVLARPFSITQIYRLYPYFIEKYTKGVLLPQVVSVTNGTAILRLKLSESTKRQFGLYLPGCAERICEAIKASIGEIPTRMFRLPPATIQDTCCMADGGEYCEWTFTWQPRGIGALVWPAIGFLLGLTLLTIVWVSHPTMSFLEGIGLVGIPSVIFWLAGTLWNDRKEIAAREKIIREQLTVTEARHEELREAYVTQEQTLVELRKHLAELTMLYQTGLRLGSRLEQESLIMVGLEAIIQDLRYDRATLSFYDSTRGIAHGTRVVGVSREWAAHAQSVQIQISDKNSIESTVFDKGEPVLIADINEALPRLLPVSQQLVAEFKTKAFIAVPLKVQNKVLGALVAERKEVGTANSEDMNLLMTLGNQLAIALDNARAYTEIEQLNVGLETKVQKRTEDLQKLNTELESVNQRLKELDRLKSQFLSHCSHELRTPLTSIKGFTENLLQERVGPLTERQNHYLTRINVNSDRLTRMIADLLDLSRIESGTVPMAFTEVSLPSLIREVIEQFQLMAQGKHLDLQGRYPQEDLVVRGDHDRLHQIVTNLVHNALKFTPERGTVQVELLQISPETIGLTVSDTGAGIPTDALTRLFEPFFQAHRDHGIGTQGLGLGLSIVKTLIDLHGGTITVHSDVGKGTTFQVHLPISQKIRSSSS